LSLVAVVAVITLGLRLVVEVRVVTVQALWENQAVAVVPQNQN
jgi:hypothetical protein